MKKLSSTYEYLILLQYLLSVCYVSGLLGIGFLHGLLHDLVHIHYSDLMQFRVIWCEMWLDIMIWFYDFMW